MNTTLSRPTLESRFAGAMLGTFVGDALGRGMVELLSATAGPGPRITSTRAMAATGIRKEGGRAP